MRMRNADFRLQTERKGYSPFLFCILKSAFCISLLVSLQAEASDKKIGTTGAQFLKIGAGARPTAMGEAFVGIADDVNAVYYNPAGLSNISRPELTAMHTQWFQDMNYEFAGFAYPTNKGAFAFSAATLKVEDLERRNNDESYQGSFEAMDAAYALSYARNLGPLVSFGLTGRYIKQEIDSYSASTLAGDVGFLKRFAKRKFSLGLAIKHFGQPVEFKNVSDPLPLTIDLGWGTVLFREKLRLGIDLRFPRDNDIQYGTGLEFKQPMGNDLRLSLRGGYNSAVTDIKDGQGYSFGGGIGFRRLDLDFAWIPFGVLGNTFRYAVHFRF